MTARRKAATYAAEFYELHPEYDFQLEPQTEQRSFMFRLEGVGYVFVCFMFVAF